VTNERNELLALEHLSKAFRSHWTYRTIRAVEDVSLEVFPAETFGFLGHNGAGKTTTIKSIVGLLHPTSGRILFEGEPIGKTDYRKELGYLPEQPYFYDHLSVLETLDFFASLHGIKSRERRERIDQTLELVHLEDRRKSSVRALSKGLQQRLGLAQAIINRPRLLLLDEPFSGLDPIGRIEVRELLLQLKQEGTTIFLSSHILSDINDICDRVAIMAHGTLRNIFKLEDTPRLYGQAFELIYLTDSKNRRMSAKLDSIADTSMERHTSQGVERVLKFSDYPSALSAMLHLVSDGTRIVSFESLAPSLEDIFMKITEEANSSGKTESAFDIEK
jgi:ABC-2 type transport system ATP-binding protein